MLLGDPALWGHRVATSLLLGDIVLIGKSLLLLKTLRHVARVHVLRLLWHAGASLLRWEMLGRGLLGRIDSVLVIHTVLSIASRFGGVQACLVYRLADGPGCN